MLTLVSVNVAMCRLCMSRLIITPLTVLVSGCMPPCIVDNKCMFSYTLVHLLLQLHTLKRGMSHWRQRTPYGVV